MLTLEEYTLQDNTTIDRQIITAGKLVVKSQYLCPMQVDTNWSWNKNTQHNVTTVPTRTILHPGLEVNTITDIHDTPKSVCTRMQAKKYISRHPICLTNSDYDYILEEIGCLYKNEFERDVEVCSNDEET